MIRKVNGVHCRMSRTISSFTTLSGWNSEMSKPRLPSTAGTRPISELSSNRNMIPIRAGAIMIGSSRAVNSQRLPGKRWCTSSASPRPVTSAIDVTTTVNRRVNLTESQKLESVTVVTKLSSPMNTG